MGFSIDLYCLFYINRDVLLLPDYIDKIIQ